MSDILNMEDIYSWIQCSTFNQDIEKLDSKAGLAQVLHSELLALSVF